MRVLASAALVGALLALQPASVLAQDGIREVHFLRDTRSHQWCAYAKLSTWHAAVQGANSAVVGTLKYSKGRLSQVDVTEVGESGDWMVYDHYVLDSRGRIRKLSRLTNVLPGDRSVFETFSIGGGKAEKVSEVQKRLSTGRVIAFPTSIWLPEVPVVTSTNLFAFSDLLNVPTLRTSEKACVPDLVDPN